MLTVLLTIIGALYGVVNLLTSADTVERFIWEGDNTCGGRVVANPSAGLRAKGRQFRVTGLAQRAEHTW